MEVADLPVALGSGSFSSTLEAENRSGRESADAATYVRILRKCCSDRCLERARLAHQKVSESRHKNDCVVQKFLVEMYGRCGSAEEAYAVFHVMHERNVVSWNVMVTAFAKNGHYDRAVQIFREMLLDGTRPHKVTYLSALDACSGLGVAAGREIHRLCTESGFDQDLAVANSLINMYGRCGNLTDAGIVFQSIQDRDVISWNCLFAAHTRNGHPAEVLALFEEMDVKPDKVTYLAVLDSCSCLAALQRGREIHHRLSMEHEELLRDTMVGNSLLNMYGKCKSVEDAARVFGFMKGNRSVVTWTGMISVYAQNGHSSRALKLFQEMDQDGTKANLVTFVTVLDACADACSLEKGRVLHSRIVEFGLSSSVIVGNSLMNMYTKSGSVDDAKNLFEELRHDNVVAWNTIMTMFLKHERYSDVLHLFSRMDNEGLRPDEITYLSVITALQDVHSPKFDQVFQRVVLEGYESNAFVGNALVSLHCQCGNLDRARKIFDGVERKGVIVWTNMLCGYAENGRGNEAVQLLREMDLEGVKPDSVTFIGAVDACASLTSLIRGKNIHERIQHVYGSNVDTNLGNALINMYGKCGNLFLARKTFDSTKKDLVSWNAMILAYAQAGHGGEALDLLLEMSLEGVEPDHITLLGVITGCANAGLLQDGVEQLMRMNDDFGLVPEMNHYGCIVDLLGRAGWLHHAQRLIAQMPVKADARAWQSLLCACQTHSDVGLGKTMTTQVVETAQNGTSAYVLLSNIIATV